MQLTWLIDADQNLERSAELQSIIRERGDECCAVKLFPDAKFPGDIVGAEHLSRDARVVFFGGPALMEHIQRHRRWRPGGWCTFDNFRCEVYYCYFGQHLLNEQYALLPACEAVRQSTRLFDQFASSGNIFVRPAAGRKLFNGSIMDHDEFQSTLTRRLDPRSLVVISSPKPIGREWRLFIAHDQVVTGSQYASSGRAEQVADCPREVIQCADRILREVQWRPDPLFTMDMCESSGRISLLEINGFSCSNHYAAYLNAIVDVASEAARHA